jgi:hypothetical protein
MRRLLMVLGAGAVFSACEQHSSSIVAMSSPDPARFLLAAPDPGFRLSESERAALSPLLDPTALESLLARVRPEHRATVLTDLNELGSAGPVAFGPMTTSIADPQLRAAVASVFRLPRGEPDRRP